MIPRKRDKVVQSASRVFVAVTVGWCLITCSLIFCLDPDIYGQLMFEVLLMFMSLAFPFSPWLSYWKYTRRGICLRRGRLLELESSQYLS